MDYQSLQKNILEEPKKIYQMRFGNLQLGFRILLIFQSCVQHLLYSYIFFNICRKTAFEQTKTPMTTYNGRGYVVILIN